MADRSAAASRKEMVFEIPLITESELLFWNINSEFLLVLSSHTAGQLQ